MTCTRCGGQLDSSGQYCPSCGLWQQQAGPPAPETPTRPAWRSPAVLATVAVCLVAVVVAVWFSGPGTPRVKTRSSGATVEVEPGDVRPPAAPASDVPQPGLSGPVSTMPGPISTMPEPVPADSAPGVLPPPRPKPDATPTRPPVSHPAPLPTADAPAKPVEPPPADVRSPEPQPPGPIVPPLPRPPVPPPPAKPYRLGPGIVPPRPIHQTEPEYPTIAVQARVEGSVLIEVTITPQGDVTAPRVLRSIPLLDEAAIEAVKRWKYTPGMLNDAPVPIVMTVTVTFSLK